MRTHVEVHGKDSALCASHIVSTSKWSVIIDCLLRPGINLSKKKAASQTDGCPMREFKSSGPS